MKTTDIYRKALQSFFSDKVTQSSLADALGIQRPLMNGFIKGRRNFSEDRKEVIAEYFGLTYIEMLNIGERLIRSETELESHSDRLLLCSSIDDEEYSYDDDLYRRVPLYESGRLAAWSNGGAFDPYEKPASEVVVYQPELEGRANHNLVAVRVGGDSMNPTIPEGAIVIVDLNDKELIDRKIYAVSLDEDGLLQAAVKRVRQAENGYVLQSDNPDYMPVITNNEWVDTCIGRVVWMWRSVLEA